jgi:hypothetical protein
MTRILWLVALLGIAVSATRAAHAAGVEKAGDVHLTYENDDFRGKRFGTEVLWVQPLSPWLDAQLGGRYAEFDGATWGHGIVGAHTLLPIGLGHLELRYEGGAGQGDAGHYAHHLGDLGWTRSLYSDWLFADAGLKLIRVDNVDEDLARVGLGVKATKWLFVRGGYHHSARAASGAELWSARTDLSFRSTLLFAGYARSRDTLDLRSIGQGRVLDDPTDEYFLGVTLPVGRHGLTVAARRFEGHDTRHTLSFTWRWSLSGWPWSTDAESGSLASAGSETSGLR